MTEVVIEPHWPQMTRWWANAMMTHSFEAGAKEPVRSFMEMVRYMAVKEPDELSEIIKEFGGKG